MRGGHAQKREADIKGSERELNSKRREVQQREQAVKHAAEKSRPPIGSAPQRHLCALLAEAQLPTNGKVMPCGPATS